MSISVIGSLNVDMVTTTVRVPEAGETLQATSFEVGWGGKGANQAVAAAKLGKSVKVKMFGAVGEDVFGPQLLKSMENDGVDVSGVRSISGKQTGTAVILVEKESGENRILVTPGANHALKLEGELVASGEYGEVVLLQLEIPLDVAIHQIKSAQAAGSVVILNPAPAVELPDDLYSEVTHLILNETEAAILSGLPRDSISASSDLDSVASSFLRKGVVSVIITLGADGVYYQTVTRQRKNMVGKRLPAAKAKVVDTTAAGDTFVGAFAVGLTSPSSISDNADELDHDMIIDQSVAFAIRASGKTVEKAGAQKSIPKFEEVPQA